MKKCLLSVFGFFLLFFVTHSASASCLSVYTDQADIPSDSEEAICALMSQGVITGTGSGAFRPNDQMERGYASKWLVLAIDETIDTSGGPHFTDIPETDSLYDYIETAYNKGWINGYPDGSFQKDTGLNRAEIAKLVMNIFGIPQDLTGAPHFDDVTSSDWFYNFVETVYNNHLMDPATVNLFAPSNPISRAESAKIIYEAQKLMGMVPGDLDVFRNPITLGNQQYNAGAADVVILNAQVVVSEDINVSGVQIQVHADTFIKDKNGNGTDHELADINAVYENFRIYINDQLKGTVPSFTLKIGGSDGNPQDYVLNFNNAFDLSGTSTLKIVGDVKLTAETGDKLKLVGYATDFTSPQYIASGQIVASTELTGQAESSFVEVELSELTVSRTDSIADGEVIVAGLDNVTMLQFVLDNNDSGDINVTSVTLQAEGTGAASTHTNFITAVFVDGTQQGSAKNFETDGNATINNLSVIIPSAAQKEFTIIVDTIESSADTDMVADTIKISMTTILADNVENGQAVDTMNNGTLLSNTNPVEGAQFELSVSGRLTATIDSVVASDIILAESNNVEVLKMRLNAMDDEVQVSDFYFINDVNSNDQIDIPQDTDAGNRLDFKLYNESGQLIQQKQMINGRLHFELANLDRIRIPKDGSATITIRVDARDITQAIQTGSQLRLVLDEKNTSVPTLDQRGYNAPSWIAQGTGTIQDGIGAITATTGNNIIEAGYIDASNVTGQDFVIYRTELSIKHAAFQPDFSDPSTLMQEAYRFTVTCHAVHQCELGRVSLDISLGGIQKLNGANLETTDFGVRAINTNGTIDNTTVVGSITDVASATATAGKITLDFENQRLSTGESKTYSLLLGNTENDTNLQTDDDNVMITILSDAQYTDPTDRATQEAGNHNLIWSDEASLIHTETTQDWENGYLLEIDQMVKINGEVMTLDPIQFALNYPQTSNVTLSTVDLKMQTQVNGVFYWIVLPKGSTAPSSDQVKNQTDASNQPVALFGDGNLLANVEKTITISGLSPETEYDIYVVAENVAAQLQGAPTNLSIMTQASEVQVEEEVIGGTLNFVSSGSLSTLQASLDDSALLVTFRDTKDNIIGSNLPGIATGLHIPAIDTEAGNVVLTQNPIVFRDTNAVSLTESLVFLPVNRGANVDNQKVLLALPSGIKLNAVGIEIAPPQLLPISTVSIPNVVIKQAVGIQTNQAVVFQDQLVDICLPGTQNSLGQSLASGVMVYSNRTGSWTLDTTVKNKKFVASTDQFCFQVDYLSDFALGVPASAIITPPSGGSAPIYTPATTTTSTTSSSSGGGERGYSSGNYTTPITLSTVQSDRLLSTTVRPINFINTHGLTTRPLEFTNTRAMIRIPQGTTITYENQAPFSGILNLPSGMNTAQKPRIPAGLKEITVFKFEPENGKYLQFSEEFSIEIPINIPQGITDPKVYFYDGKAQQYKMVGDGGRWTQDQKSIAVKVGHTGIFAVLGKEYELGYAPMEPLSLLLKDLEVSAWYYPYVNELLDTKVVHGYPDKTYRPGGTLNRAEIAKMVALKFRLDIPNNLQENPYPDVPKKDWYAPYVQALKNAGILEDRGNYRPGEAVTRAEMVRMVVLAGALEIDETGKTFPDVSQGASAFPFIQTAKNFGIVEGYPNGDFGPNRSLNRAEMAKILVLAGRI